MTICIATDNNINSNNGIGTFNRHLSSLLLWAGHKVILLCTDENAINEPDEIISKGNLITIVFKESYLREKEKYRHYYSPGSFDAPRWIAMGKTYASWLKHNTEHYKIDIIDVSDYGGIGIFLCQAGLPPVVISFHGPLLQICNYNYCPRDDHYKVIQRMEELSFEHGDSIITHSSTSFDAAKSLTTTTVYKTTIPWINDQPESLQVKGGYSLVVGGLQNIKGAECLAKAISTINTQSQDVSVRWLGEDSYSSPTLTLFSSYLQKKYPGIWNRKFIWDGQVDHTTALQKIKGADFIIIPSLWETFNYVAIEAAQAGKAIIITDQTGAVELFKHNENALIIEAANETALANAITELGNDPVKREQLGNHAKLMIHNFFKNDLIFDRISIYEEVIEKFKGHEMQGNELSFLDQYHSIYRRSYFQLRKNVKRIIGKN